MLHHNTETRVNKMGRDPKEVAIFLNSYFIKAYIKAGSPPPTYMPKGDFEGRFIGIPLIFDNYDDYGENIRGVAKTFLTPIYNFVEPKEQRAFDKILATIWDIIPSSYHVIHGHDVNVNVGIREDDDPRKKVIGPNGLNNQNVKGNKLLNTMVSKNLRLVNSFFKKKLCGT